MRITSKKRAILDALTGQGPEDYFERGTPPYSAAEVRQALGGGDLSNIVKTLTAMERDGLVVSEKAKRPVWNAIARDHLERTCTCYWNGATMEADQAAAKEWNDGANARSEDALEGLFTVAKR